MSAIVRSGIAAIFGAIFGVAVSWIVNCTLVEISLNSFFSVYFGTLFLLIGGIIFWRIFAGGPAMGQPARKPLLVTNLQGSLRFDRVRREKSFDDFTASGDGNNS